MGEEKIYNGFIFVHYWKSKVTLVANFKKKGGNNMERFAIHF